MECKSQHVIADTNIIPLHQKSEDIATWCICDSNRVKCCLVERHQVHLCVIDNTNAVYGTDLIISLLIEEHMV